MKKIKHTLITHQEAEKLIVKYYEGGTSVTEERQLQEFLSQKNLPAQFEAEKAMFGYFESEKPTKKRIQLPRNFKWMASAAVVAGIAFLSVIFINKPAESNYAYINGVKTTDLQMIKTLAQSTVYSLAEENTELESDLKNIRENNVIDNQLDVFSGIEF